MPYSKLNCPSELPSLSSSSDSSVKVNFVPIRRRIKKPTADLKDDQDDGKDDDDNDIDDDCKSCKCGYSYAESEGCQW